MAIETDGNGTFTFGGKIYSVTGNGATFNTDDNSAVKSVADLNGTLSGDLGTIELGNITVVADDPVTLNAANGELISISASGDATVSGVENIAVNNVTLANNSPATVTVANGTVSDITGFDGSVTGLGNGTLAASGSVTVNGSPIDITGNYNAVISNSSVTGVTGVDKNATVTSAPNMTVETEGDGTFTFGSDKYTVSNGGNDVTFTTDNNSKATAIDSLNGTLTGNFDSPLEVAGITLDTDAPVTLVAADNVANSVKGTGTIDGLTNGTVETTGDATVNGVAVNNDSNVTLSVANGSVTKASGLDGGTISGLTNAQVSANDKATVNGKAIDVAGDADGYEVTVVNGTATKVTDVDPNSSVDSAPNMAVVTDGDGQFTFGSDKYTVDNGGEDVTFITDDNSNATALDLDGTLTGDFENPLEIGDATFTTGGESVTIVAADNEVASVAGGKEVTGLKNATVSATDKATVNGKALDVEGDADGYDVTVVDGVATSISDVDSGASVNSAPSMTVVTDGDGDFTFGSDKYSIDNGGEDVTFRTDNDGSPTAIDSLNGTLAGDFDKPLEVAGTTLEGGEPVTLTAEDNKATNVIGGNGADGITDGVLALTGKATVNGKGFDIDGDYNVVVDDGTATAVTGISDGTNVEAAPNVAIIPTGTGKYTIGGTPYEILGVEGTPTIQTDGNSDVKSVDAAAITLTGGTDDLTINDATLQSSNGNLTVASDGTNITAVNGLESGDSLAGNLETAAVVLPNGTATVNGVGYTIAGDNNGAILSDDGKVVTGLAKDASLTVSEADDYTVNGDAFTARAGDTFIANEDGIYRYDPQNKPVTETMSGAAVINSELGEASASTETLSSAEAISRIESGDLDAPLAMVLDNTGGDSVQAADFSNTQYPKRVTLEGGNQSLKFNDEGSNSAYVSPTAEGRKAIELGNGDDLAVVDSPYAKTSVKAGLGNDTVAVRNDARATVDVSNNGNTKIVPTSGRVTLSNYTDDNNAVIQTFDYTHIGDAVKENAIKFGNGTATIGDAAIVLKPDAETSGGTFVDIMNARGETQAVAFTHTAGGVLNASASADDFVMKGNYAEKTSDTTKSGGSSLIGGSGDDTMLVGAADFVDGGNGDNQIYITDENLRRTSPDGAVVALSGKGHDTVHGFHGGFDDNSDKVQINASDIPNLKFSYDEDGLRMRLGQAQITFDGMTPETTAATESADLSESADMVDEDYLVNESYEELTISNDDATIGLGSAAFQKLILTDGNHDYNAAIAQDGKAIAVTDTDDTAEIYYGNRSGLNFSEYNGAVEVNMNTNAGYINGSAAMFYGLTQLQGGSGNTTLVGNASEQNLLIAGSGNTSMWGGGRSSDLMVGNNAADKNGLTMYYYLSGDGKDTISAFDFAANSRDYTSDIINVTEDNEVTDVFMSGNNVLLRINNSDNDYLTLQDAAGKDFRISGANDLVAKVDTNADFDNLANCYVANATNATMTVGENLGNAQIWLDDGDTGTHGIYYKGEFKFIDATAANGNNTLVGNDLDNVIVGGTGVNSIWGGYGMNNDMLTGGTGRNTFFYGNSNGNDTVTNAHDGDVVDMTTVNVEDISETLIDADKVTVYMKDGGSLEVQSNAEVDYKLADGNTYRADHASGIWTKK